MYLGKTRWLENGKRMREKVCAWVWNRSTYKYIHIYMDKMCSSWLINGQGTTLYPPRRPVAVDPVCVPNERNQRPVIICTRCRAQRAKVKKKLPNGTLACARCRIAEPNEMVDNEILSFFFVLFVSRRTSRFVMRCSFPKTVLHVDRHVVRPCHCDFCIAAHPSSTRVAVR